MDIILLAAEGGCLIPLALLYLYWVRRSVAKDRASLYSTFLRVPRPTVVAIAKTEVKLVGEDGDDDDDEPAVCIFCLLLRIKRSGFGSGYSKSMAVSFVRASIQSRSSGCLLPASFPHLLNKQNMRFWQTCSL